MALTLHNDSLTALKGIGRGEKSMSGLRGLIQDQALVPSSRKSHLLMIHQEPNALVCVLGIKINTLVNECILSPGLINMSIPNSSPSFIAPCLPNPHTTVVLCLLSNTKRRKLLLKFRLLLCEHLWANKLWMWFSSLSLLGTHISLPTHWGPMHLAEMSWCSVGWL